MKKIYLIIILLVVVLVLGGCFNDAIEEANQDQAQEPDATDQIVDVATKNSEPKDEIQRFYPDQSSVTKKSATADASVQANNIERNFTVTQELQTKLYLVDKYSPGTCYGMPGPVPQVAIDGMIERNPGLSVFLLKRYSLAGDLDIYNKIKQINGVQLTTMVGGKYQFNFIDGQCCTLTAYEGEISIIGQNITEKVTNQATHENPC